jgi:probable O-glycosylation ligase (exosortase A-associated)
LLAIAGTFGLFILQAIPWAIYTAGRERLYGPEGSMLADNNDFGLALNMTSPIFFFLATTESKPWVRRLMAFLFLASIPAVFLTYSRGSLVSLAVVVFLMLMRLPQRFALVPVLMIAALFALYFAPDRWVNRMDFRREGAVLDDSALSRINAWTYSWRLAVNYPLMGGGFEAFTPTLFYRYAPNPLDVHGPHSIYFGILAEHGFIGLFLYLALVASCLKTLQQVRKYGRQSQNDRAAAYALMLQFCLLAFLVAGAFLGRAYFDYYFTIVACTVMLKRICQAEAAELECAPVEPEAEEQMA